MIVYGIQWWPVQMNENENAELLCMFSFNQVNEHERWRNKKSRAKEKGRTAFFSKKTVWSAIWAGAETIFKKMIEFVYSVHSTESYKLNCFETGWNTTTTQLSTTTKQFSTSFSLPQSTLYPILSCFPCFVLLFLTMKIFNMSQANLYYFFSSLHLFDKSSSSSYKPADKIQINW